PCVLTATAWFNANTNEGLAGVGLAPGVALETVRGVRWAVPLPNRAMADPAAAAMTITATPAAIMIRDRGQDLRPGALGNCGEGWFDERGSLMHGCSWIAGAGRIGGAA